LKIFISFSIIKKYNSLILQTLVCLIYPALHPLNLIYTSLIPWSLSQVTLTYAGSPHFKCRIVCLFSIVLFVPKVSTIPRPFEVFHRVTIFFMMSFFLEPRPNPKLEDHPFSGVLECLFNAFATVLHIWRPFLHPHSEDVPCRGHR